MSGFTSDWLSLRRGADLRARNRDLAAKLSRYFEGRAQLKVVDIGSGTGANLRATSTLLPPGQSWLLTDHDPALLARVDAPEGITYRTQALDLANSLDMVWDMAPDLVTASAFFDLCGADWLDAFVDGLSQSRAALYAVLTYDGRECWLPPCPDDAAVRAAFHADQGRDKGLGPSLGPGAHDYLAEALRQAGYAIAEGSSDWNLAPPDDALLIAELARGSAAAVAPSVGAEVAEAWRDARQSATHVMIGHQDLFAWPPAQG